MLKANGLDEAIIGYGSQPGSDYVIVYDAQKIVDILVDRDGMEREEAWEYFYFNIEGAYVGKLTPIYVYSADAEELDLMQEELHVEGHEHD
jgi:hypothetical protein